MEDPYSKQHLQSISKSVVEIKALVKDKQKDENTTAGLAPGSRMRQTDMRSPSSPSYRSVDISEAVVVAGFLDTWNRWLLVVMAYSVLVFAATQSATALEILAAAAVSLVGVRYPTRLWLLPWAVLLGGASAAASVYFAVKFVSTARDSSFALIVPYAVVATFFWVALRVRNREHSMIDMGGSFPDSAVPSILATPEPSGSWMKRAGELLSGGFVTAVVLGIILCAWYLLWYFFGEDLQLFPGCLWLFLALAFGTAVPWFYIPAIRAIAEKSSISLVRSARFNPRKSRRLPYALFLIGQSLSRPRAALWFVAAAVCLAAIVADFLLKVWPREMLRDPVWAGVPHWLAIALFGISLYCYRRGCPHALRRHESWRPPAGETFTLYLRSFADDHIEVLRDGLMYRVWIVDVSMNIFRFLRFEEIVASTAFPFGRMVALGQPVATEATRTLSAAESRTLLGGAERITAGEQWQSEVRELAHRAGSILITAGFTSGLKWELEQFAGSDDIRKVMLLMPPGDEQSLIRTWHEFTANIPALQQCGEAVVGRTIAVKFRAPSDPPLILLADRRSVAACKLALKACWLPDEVLAGIAARDQA